MVTAERNQNIYEVRKKLGWPYSRIAETYGISRQRAAEVVQQVERRVTIEAMDATKEPLIALPMSATEAAKVSGVPRDAIIKWVERGLVKVVRRPDRAKACTNNPVLLDPVTLQARIDAYRLRKQHIRN